MAKLEKPDPMLIGKLGKDLDFYYYLGIPCVRIMPQRMRQPGTPAQVETWNAFRQSLSGYADLEQEDRQAFKRLAAGSHMSGRDFYQKWIMEGWKKRGDNFAYSRANFQVFPNGVNIIFYKLVDASMILYFMTEKERERYIFWEEGSPCIRGRKWRRRWYLHEELGEVKDTRRFARGAGALLARFPKGSDIAYATGEIDRADPVYYGRIGLFDIRYPPG